MEIAIAKIANSIVSAAAPQALKTLQSKLNPSDIEKAIRAGIIAAKERETTLAPQQSLFYRSEPDLCRSLPQSLFESRRGVERIGQSLKRRRTARCGILGQGIRAIGRTRRQNSSIHAAITAWIDEFIKHYFQQTSTYLKFQVAKEDYLRQLCEQYDDVKFARCEADL